MGSDTIEKTSLSARIKADPELMEALSRRPDLLAELENKVTAVENLDARVQLYLSDTLEGFDQLLSALILMEVPTDPATGQPQLTPQGLFAFPKVDKQGRMLLERFFAWQRIFHMWPRLEHHVQTCERLTDTEKKLRLSAVRLVRTMLQEQEIVAGVC